MKIENFEDIIAWQKSNELTLAIYSFFKTCMDYSFKDQIQRAAISTMNNIAEGYERRTNKEFKNFLYVSKGSCGEVRSMVYIALKLKYIDGQQFEKIYFLTIEISKLLSGLIKTL